MFTGFQRKTDSLIFGQKHVHFSVEILIFLIFQHHTKISKKSQFFPSSKSWISTITTSINFTQFTKHSTQKLQLSSMVITSSAFSISNVAIFSSDVELSICYGCCIHDGIKMRIKHVCSIYMSAMHEKFLCSFPCNFLEDFNGNLKNWFFFVFYCIF